MIIAFSTPSAVPLRSLSTPSTSRCAALPRTDNNNNNNSNTPRATLLTSPPPASSSPSSSTAVRVASTPLKQRSVISLRALSDTAAIALLHELSLRCLSMSPTPSVAFASDCQLLLGGLIGVWTAAAFARRSSPLYPFSSPIPPSSASTSISEHIQLNDIADVDVDVQLDAQVDADVPNLCPDDIEPVLAWLAAFDEIEGPATALLIRQLVASGDTRTRAALAAALSNTPVRANVALAALSRLRTDWSPSVRRSATSATRAFQSAGILHISSSPPSSSSASSDLHFPPAGSRAALQRTLDYPLPVRIPPAAVPSTTAALSDMATDRNTKQQLVDNLRIEEVHGICALALAPISYEIAAVVQGEHLPLRLLGLGWLLAVAGLTAYPRSASLWASFTAMIHRMQSIPNPKSV